MVKKNLPIYLLLIFAIFSQLLLALHPAYYSHLSTDVYVFYNRAVFFLNHLNLSNLSGNEYQPGALLFFIMLSPILLINNSFETFTWALFAFNTVFILLLALIYKKSTNSTDSILILSLILLAIGPIFFFRFDLLVATLVCTSLLLWKNNKQLTSSFILGIATTIKVYPAIFLPYLLILSFRGKGIYQVLKNLIAYFSGLSLIILLFLVSFQIKITDMLYAFNFHLQKPISLESPLANLIMLISLIRDGVLPPLVNNWGIWGISEQVMILPTQLYNYFWIIPLIIVLIWFIRNNSHSQPKLDIYFCITIILLFLIFSKVFAPQYIIWVVTLLPMVEFKNLINTNWAINLFLVLSATFLFQYIYPLNYSSWLNSFSSPEVSFLFILNSLRNLLLVILAIRLVRGLSLSKR